MTAHILGSNGAHQMHSPSPKEVNTTTSDKKVDQAAQSEFKQAQAEAAAAREFFIEDIMKTKQVSREDAAAEYDFFS